MLMKREDALKLLDLKEGASKDDIEFQYIDIAILNHPYRKSSNLKTTKIFKDVSIAYKRLLQSPDEDWVDQFNSMDLFQSVYGDVTDSDFEDYFDDDDNDNWDGYCGGSICRHFRCAFCCPFCDDQEYFHFDFKEYDNMKQKADKMAEELMKEEVEEKKKACQRKEKKSRRRERRKSLKESTDPNENESFVSTHTCPGMQKLVKRRRRKVLAEISHKSIHNIKDHKKLQTQNFKIENDNSSKEAEALNKPHVAKEGKNDEKKNPVENSASSAKCFKNWMSASKIADENKYDVLNIVNDDSEHNDVKKKSSKIKKSKTSALKKATIKKNSAKKENFVPSYPSQDAVTISRQLASQGNLLAGNEEYAEAAKLFSHAISLLNTEHRYYGNRSFCYDRMKEYKKLSPKKSSLQRILVPLHSFLDVRRDEGYKKGFQHFQPQKSKIKALQDAEVAIFLSPSWAKGFFRKGRALAGLKRYTEAEKAYEEVLRLDKSCPETKRQLREVRLANLMDMGFERNLCELALRKTSCVQFALDELLSGNLSKVTTKEIYVSDDEDSMIFDEEINKKIPPQKRQPSPTPDSDCKSLWIGNMQACVSEKALEDYFRQYGKIVSVKVLYDRHCAFVNFAAATSAQRAVKAANTVEVSGMKLLVRFPEKNPQKAAISTSTAETLECRFWRSTGCVFGSLCRYQHVPAHKGIDCLVVERTPYQSVAKCS